MGNKYDWSRIDHAAPMHDKVLALPDDGTRWRWLVTVLLAGRMNTPRLTRRQLLASRVDDHDIGAMLYAGLLDPDPDDGEAYIVHDWAEYQPRAVTIDPSRAGTRPCAHPGRASRDAAPQASRRNATQRDATLRVTTPLDPPPPPNADVDPDDVPAAPRALTDPRMEMLRDSGPRMTVAQWRSWDDFDRPEWQPFKEAWLGRGFLLAPTGEKDGDESLRTMLWEVAAARPNDLGRWVREAPPGDRRSVVAYVLDRWHDIRDAIVEPPRPASRRARSHGPTRIGALLADAAEAGL